MAAHTIAEVQDKLSNLGFYNGDIDGLGGPLTAEAVAKFQEMKQLTVTGKLDPTTLQYLFPGVPEGPKTIKATIADYALNFAKSKTVWAAGALVAFLVTWVQTKFGLDVSPEVQNLVTQGIVYAFGALIAVLQTAFNSPHMTTKQPGVVQKPAEFK